MKQKGLILNSLLFFGTLCLFSHLAHADLSVAKEIEAQKIFFDTAQYQIDSDMDLILGQTVTLLGRMEEPYTLKVLGFADSKGPDELNQTLSLQRANEAAAYLIARGIDQSRILVQGMGAQQPLASNDTEEGRAKNRRVEFKFLVPDTSEVKPAVPIVTESPPEVPTAEVSQPIETPELAEPQMIVQQPAEALKMIIPSGSDETMIAPARKSKGRSKIHHVYDSRKRSEEGQAYAQFMPLWLTMDHAKALGATDDRIETRLSVNGELGWMAFFEDSDEIFFSARGYGSILRFDQDSASLLNKQKDYTFGGELGVGRFFHPNFSVQIQAGYGRELFYQRLGANIFVNTDYMLHGGLSSEWVLWRFTSKGDLGFNGFYNYYDLGLDELDTGWGSGANLFVDLDMLRAGFNFTFLDLQTQTLKYNTWFFGPTIRYYF